MRTTDSLVKADNYVNGTPVYKGDVERLYASGMFLSLQVHLVRAPHGAEIGYMADDELKQVIKKLKPGQIGALKELSEEQVIGSEPFFEAIIPCDKDNTIFVAEVCRGLTKPSNITDGMTCTIGKKPIAVETAKEMLVSKRDSNREIQNRWIEFVKTERAKSLSSAAKLEQKARIYSDYYSLTEYTIVVSGRIQHVVNNPGLNSTVVKNVDEAYYDLVNYTNGNIRVRKFAQDRLQLVSIPIVTVGDYKKALTVLKKVMKGSDGFKRLKTLGAEEVFHEGGLFGNATIDWDMLRKHDSLARISYLKA